MPTFNTTELINNLQSQTEDFLQKAISDWQIISPTKLLQQPAANKWSAAQCLGHLNSYGRYYLPEIKKAIEKEKQNLHAAKEEFASGFLGNYFTKMMDPKPKGKKMKKMSAPKNHKPAANLDTHKVVSEFIEQQEHLLTLLEKARKIDLEKARVPISIAKFIKLRLGDTFRFLIMHTYRHVLQAQRALEQTRNLGEKQAAISK